MDEKQAQAADHTLGRVLIVDDSRFAALLESKRLAEAGLEVHVVHSGAEAMAAITAFSYELALLDYKLPGTDGLSLYRRMRSQGFQGDAILVTGAGSEELAVAALKDGIKDYVPKTGQWVDRLEHATLAALREREMRAELRRREGALRQSESTARVLLDALQLPTLLVDEDGEIISANEAARAELALGPEANAFDHLPACPDRATLASLFADCRRHGQGQRLEYDHAGRRFELRVQPVVEEGGAVHLLAMHLEDVTARWQEAKALRRANTSAEEELARRAAELAQANARLRREVTQRRQEEQRFRSLVESSLQGVLVHRDLAPVFANRTMATLAGYDSVRHLLERPTLADLVHPEDLERVRRRAARWSRRGGDHVLRSVVNAWSIDGDRRMLETFSRPIPWDHEGAAILTTVIDITERTALEEQLRHSQKLEAVGRLAGGIAHDFNNLLQIVQGFTEMAQSATAEPHKLRRYLERIEKATGDGGRLVHRLLTFSRKSVLRKGRVDLNGLISSATQFLERLMLGKADLTLDLRPDCGMVEADSGQLDQVIVNLCVNARDAMPAQGGTITLATSRFVADAAFCRARPWARPGPYALLTVTDTGGGIPTAEQSRIFEPFYTTKGVGEGTGLGLSIVYGIVEQHSGHIEVQSAPDEGTTFTVYLPALNDARIASPPQAVGQQVCGRGETLLLVEDDDVVRDVLCNMLASGGYHVLTARDGLEGIAAFSTHQRQVDLVVLDMIMPGLDGGQVLRRIRTLDRQVPVLLSTGYTSEATGPELDHAQPVEVIEKPYTSETLHHRVREMLDRAAAQHAPSPAQG